MESTVGATVRAQMEELRLKCAGEIPIMQRRIDSVTATFRKSLDSDKSKAQETVQLQGNQLPLLNPNFNPPHFTISVETRYFASIGGLFS